jgi:formate hydrogenlyase subunit 3/multisubunit Na+/H+ antiporter MnhD subunit
MRQSHGMKIVIIVALIGVLAALASAGVFMLKRPKQGESAEADKRMARALALRVGLSVTIFLLILLAWKLGWIVPKGLPTGR